VLPAASAALVVLARPAEFLTLDFPEALLQRFVEASAIMR